MLLGEMESTPAALRRNFPPPICRSRSLFRGFSIYGRLLAIYVEGLFFIVGFRSRRSRGRKDRRQRSHEAPEGVGPTRPRNLAAWATPFWAPGLPSFAFFTPKSSSFIKLTLINFQVTWTSFGSLKHQNIENRVFCQCRVNSRKIGKL